MTVVLPSWGRYPRAVQRAVPVLRRDWPLPGYSGHALPRGNGRSYGDVCLNDGGTLLLAERLDRFIAFDHAQGLLRCESGVTLAQILDLVVPAGWFLPVTPGTKFVTVGGAVANDVHGKNHHRSGTFGRHVVQFELLRSDGTRRVCSRQDAPEWFAATVGGLGLTGLITWAELKLVRIPSPWLATETIRFRSLGEFFDLSRASDGTHEYTVAWIDCAALGKKTGRGLFMRANHAAAPARARPHREGKALRVPVELPFSPITPMVLRAFNALYYRRQIGRARRAVSHYDPFFYPLDRIGSWNRLYGPNGFVQHQSVVALDAETALDRMLRTIAESGAGSFLAVLKVFGHIASPGLLSFPRPGASLALDFPWRGEATAALLRRLDCIVDAAQGAVYPAKDACMTAASFQRSFPAWERYAAFIDPSFSSSFWRRVTG